MDWKEPPRPGHGWLRLCLPSLLAGGLQVRWCNRCLRFPGVKDNPLWGGRREILVFSFQGWNSFGLDNTFLVVTWLHPKFGGHRSIPFHCFQQSNVASRAHVLLWDLESSFSAMTGRLLTCIFPPTYRRWRVCFFMFIKTDEDIAFQLPPYFKNYFPVIWGNLYLELTARSLACNLVWLPPSTQTGATRVLPLGLTQVHYI